MGRFICKHNKTLLIAAWVVFAVGLIVSLVYDVPTYGIWLWGALFLAVYLFGIFFVPIRKILKANTAHQQQCDPYPLRDVCAFLTTCSLSKSTRLTAAIDYAAALSECGEAARAYQVLHTLNIEENGTAPLQKCIYYFNLQALCDELGLIPEADACYRQVLAWYAQLPKKQQEQCRQAPTITQAMYAYQHGDPLETMRLLQATPCTSPASGVGMALLFAKAAIAAGQTQAARDNLDYVIANGNRLAAVDQAKALLATLTTQEETRT